MSSNEKSNRPDLPVCEEPARIKDSGPVGGYEPSVAGVSPEFFRSLPMEQARFVHEIAKHQRRNNSPWMTIQEAADYLHVSLSQMKKWKGTGVISPYYAKGMTHPRFRREQLDNLLQQKRLPKHE